MSLAFRSAKWTHIRTACHGFNMRRAFGTEAGYAETPLQSARSQIRLLEIHPGPWNDTGDPVEGTLFRTNLSDAPSYEALSYHWGKASARRVITLNGRDVKIQENLESALRHLRHVDQRRILWVDALCINQDDVHERNAQVAIMHEIYRRADRTVAWIGNGQEDGELALGFLRERAIRRNSAWSGNLGASDPEYELRGQKAVQRLLQRPYWRRLWVMQEIALSPAPPQVVCGQSSIGWTALVKALNDDLTAPYVHRLHRIRGATLDLISGRRRNKSNEIGRYVILLLSYSAGFQTSEQKDRVYALYGLFKVAGIVGFKPDYSISLADVYQQLTEYVLAMKGGLDVLELRPHDQDPDLPSWVVDLSKRPPLSYNPRGSRLWQRTEQKLPRASVSDTAFSDRLLKVTGVTIDEVSHVESVPSCLATAFRAAADSPVTRIFGGHSLRSDNVEATRYWASKEISSHSNDICSTTIEFLSRWRSIISYFCKRGTRTEGQSHDIWDWDQLTREVPMCSPKPSQPSTDSESELVDGQHLPINDMSIFESKHRDALDPLLSSLSIMMQGRACLSTKKGLHGVSLIGISAGDKIVAFQATKQVHILRPLDSSRNDYQYVGAAILCASHYDADGERHLRAIYRTVARDSSLDEIFILR